MFPDIVKKQRYVPGAYCFSSVFSESSMALESSMFPDFVKTQPYVHEARCFSPVFPELYVPRLCKKQQPFVPVVSAVFPESPMFPESYVAVLC